MPCTAQDQDADHGTAQLGISLMQANGVGGTGIAYAVDPYFSVANGNPGIDFDLKRCIGVLGAGDVILISLALQSPVNRQNGTVPADWFPNDFKLIKQLVGNGVTVVEGAGNSGAGDQFGLNLDDCPGYLDPNDRPYKPGSERSGAIIVGAGHPPQDDAHYGDFNSGGDDPNSWLRFSNYGSYVDLQAYGLYVFAPTTGAGDPLVSDPNDNNWAYTRGHAGTSSASAIVAGCCATAQSAYLAYAGGDTHYLLSPEDLKDLFVRTGIPQVQNRGSTSNFFPHIGQMPSLKKALKHIVLRSNYNSDRYNDITWRNVASGQNLFWMMNGSSCSSQVQTSGVSDPNWRIVSNEDFNGDGKGDLLWRNSVTGDVDIWIMNGAAVVSISHLTHVDPVWRIEATGDLDNDGNPDIFWRNSQTGENNIWVMNGTSRTAILTLPTVPDLNWHMVGVGDFNKDGWEDIVWRNGFTGEVDAWVMSGNTYVQAYKISTVDPVWEICGVGDYNHDGQSDLVWRNSSTGEVDFWYMNGMSVASINHDAYVVGDLNWKIEGPR